MGLSDLEVQSNTTLPVRPLILTPAIDVTDTIKEQFPRGYSMAFSVISGMNTNAVGQKSPNPIELKDLTLVGDNLMSLVKDFNSREPLKARAISETPRDAVTLRLQQTKPTSIDAGIDLGIKFKDHVDPEKLAAKHGIAMTTQGRVLVSKAVAMQHGWTRSNP